MIPNIIHFIYGLAPDFGGKHFCLVHYLAIKSACMVNKPDKIFLHYTYEPEGYWWEKARELAELSPVAPFDSIYGHPIFHVAHKSDVVRLQKLIETGGIYLDIDTICVKPFTPLLRYPFVMGLEGKDGLCNAVMLSEPHATFAEAMLETYQNFRSKGFDDHWGENSVLLPFQMAQSKPFKDKIHVEPECSFFYPSYTPEDLNSLFCEDHIFEKAYCFHLWETFSYEKYLQQITVEKILHENTTYNRVARNFIPADML